MRWTIVEHRRANWQAVNEDFGRSVRNWISVDLSTDARLIKLKNRTTSRGTLQLRRLIEAPFFVRDNNLWMADELNKLKNTWFRIDKK